MSQMSGVVLKPPAAPVSLPPVDNSHSNLMEEIRKGGTLKHVSPQKVSKAAVDTRGELMGQIRQGVALKKGTSRSARQQWSSQLQALPGSIIIVNM